MRAYPEGEARADWTAQPVARHYSVVLGKMLDAGRSPKGDDVTQPYLRAANVQDRGLALESVNEMAFTSAERLALDLCADDLLVVEGGAVGTVQVLDADMPGWSFQKTLNRVRASTSGARTRYLAYVLRDLRDRGAIDVLCNKSTIPHLTAEKLLALKVPFPPAGEQDLIVKYLDRETARIDQLIIEQEDLVAAMTLRRDAAVRAAVWAKASWQRVRNKNVLFETQDLSPSGSEELLSVSHITGVGARADMDVHMTEALSTVGYKVVRPEDLVINTLWGWMGALGVSQLHGIVSPAYGTYRAIDASSVDMRFFGYLYRSSGYVGLIGANSRGVWSSRLRIYPETFLAMPVDVPPLAEQTKIADELDAVTTHFDGLSQECRELIALLQERRAALITAAVTGHIDVRSKVDSHDD